MPSIAFRAAWLAGFFGIARAGTQSLTVVMLVSLATAQTLPDASNCGNIVQVSDSQRMPPFDVDRFLCLPPNFSVSVYARVPAARFLAMTPDGKLLVSQPATGSIVLVEKQDDGSAATFSFDTGLARAQDMLFHDDPDGGTYLYVAEATRISRYPYVAGDYGLHDGQVLIDGLPSSSSDELRAAYAHELKNIAVDSGGRIYVSIASATNADPSERYSNPARGAIYVYDPDGSNGRLYAQGLRNAEGVRFFPGTDLLWAAVNNRDNLAYPFHDDSGWYGQVLQEYVNDHPPDEFTFVRDGGDYGWPFANPNPETESGWDNMPFDADMQNNADGLNQPIDFFDRITKGIPAHSAPLGLTFLQNTNFPAQYADGALIALHGSWNRNPPTGYKVIYFPWNSDTQLPGAQQDFASGWLNGDTGQYWGRPVATAIDIEGAVFISDDYSGTIYRVTYSDPSR